MPNTKIWAKRQEREFQLIVGLLFSYLLFAALVFFVDFDLVRNGTDFANYYNVYLYVTESNLVDWFGSEVALPLYYILIRWCVGTLQVTDFFFWHFMLIFVALLLAISRTSRSLSMYLVLLILVDYQLAPHLARQYLSLSVILIALRAFADNRRMITILPWVMLSYFIHNTAPLFFLVGAIFVAVSPRIILILLYCALLSALTSFALVFIEVLRLVQGFPVIGKAYFALEVLTMSGETSPRLLAVIGFAVFLAMPPSRWYEKVCAGFLALTVFFYPIPILNTRIGLLGSSILIGVPFWMVVCRLGQFVRFGSKQRTSLY